MAVQTYQIPVVAVTQMLHIQNTLAQRICIPKQSTLEKLLEAEVHS